MGENKENQDNNFKKTFEKTLYIAGMIFFSIVFIACAIYLGKYLIENKKSENRVDDLRSLIKVEKNTEKSIGDSNEASNNNEATEEAISYVSVNGKEIQEKFAELYRMNYDFIGWLSIDDTVIDYPVMYSLNDKEYYLHRDFDKEYSGAGTLFIDTASSISPQSDNLIIYGHNMKTGTMFHSLLDYEKEDYYQKHKYISFDTIYDNGTYEVIAAFRSSVYPVNYTGFKYYHFFNAANSYEFDEFITNCKNLTPYEIPTTAKYGDKLITLSTCAYHSENGRFVVVAKKIPN